MLNVILDVVHWKFLISEPKIQKNANHYLEGVLAFPEHLVNEMGIEEFRKKAPELIEKYMEEIKDQLAAEKQVEYWNIEGNKKYKSLDLLLFQNLIYF